VRPLRPALLLLLAFLVFSAIQPIWRIDPDAAAYMSLGRAVGSGEGYALDGALHAKYPPGLPLLWAGLGGLFGRDAYGVFHAALVLAWLISVVLAHGLARDLGLGAPAALAVAACTGLSQTLFGLSVGYLRSEPLFLLASLGALRMGLRALSPAGATRHALAAGLLTVAALSVRLAGVSLLAIPALALWRGPAGPRRRALLVLTLGLGAVLGWWAWGQHVRSVHPDAPDYATEFLAAAPRDLTKVVQVDVPLLDGPALVQRIGGNLKAQARASAVLLTNVIKAGARLPVGLVALAFVLLGLLRLLSPPADRGPRGQQLSEDARSARRAAAVYVLATLGLYAVWPFDQQERFYVPLLPLLLVAAGQGVLAADSLLRRCAQRPSTRWVALVAMVSVLAVLALQRSDDPQVLGRWSRTYAALLLVTTGAVAVLSHRLRQPDPRELPQAACLLLPLAFCVPFAATRFRDWPETVQAFEDHRLAQPQAEPLASIDVHTVLEQVALFLAKNTEPDTVVMTDVPKMLAILSGRRCIPFVYRAQPPDVLPGDADLVFYTGEIPEATAVIEACVDRLEPVLRLEALSDGQRMVVPTVWRPIPPGS
jgi:hypothetical protein